MRNSRPSPIIFTILFICSIAGLSQTIPTPTITVIGLPVACSGQSVLLSSSASQGNIWSNGANTPSIWAGTSGTYSVQQVVGSFTSAPSAPVSVTIFPFIQASIVPVGTLCSNSNPVLLQGLPPGGIFSGQAMVGSLFQPSLAYMGANNTVTYQVSAPGYPLLCVDTAVIRLTVYICNADNAEPFAKNEAKIIPNPSNSSICVASPKGESVKCFRLLSMKGEVLLEKESRNYFQSSFDVSDLPPGSYLAEIWFQGDVLPRRLRFIKSD